MRFRLRLDGKLGCSVRIYNLLYDCQNESCIETPTLSFISESALPFALWGGKQAIIPAAA